MLLTHAQIPTVEVKLLREKNDTHETLVFNPLNFSLTILSGAVVGLILEIRPNRDAVILPFLRLQLFRIVTLPTSTDSNQPCLKL